MVLGMSLETFTVLHVVISLVGIASGLVVLFGLLNGKLVDRWTATFLVSTILTSATGYLFPVHRLLPSHVVGGISLVALAISVAARYRFALAGAWRSTYVVTAMIAFYLNVFVLIIQSFQKIAPLHALAPTGTEGPFKITQLALLVIFSGLTVAAVRKFKPVAGVGSKAVAAR